MTTPELELLPELDHYVDKFERAWQEGGGVELAAYLPPREHPSFDRIACELFCIDLEMRWARKSPKPMSEYTTEHPLLFRKGLIRQEVAFEEYRQRLQAGEPVQPEEYVGRYGVDTSDWPTAPDLESSVEVQRTQVLAGPAIVNPTPSTTGDRASTGEEGDRSIEREFKSAHKIVGRLPKSGEKVFGFDLVEVLGEGAFARVFLARQSKLADRPVALKVAVSNSDEPRKLARLQHTNIVPIYSTHQRPGLYAVCMPYLGSLTLENLLKGMGAMPSTLPKSGRELLSTLYSKHSTTVEGAHVREKAEVPARPTQTHAATPILDMMMRFSHVQAVLWLGARIADGLAHAHERGILHLDLKPANILMTDDGQPMLLDFNLSVDLSVVHSLDRVRLGGTLPYMSPEQLEAFSGGKRQIDARSDLFSLGLILYEFLTGVPPFPKRLGQMKEVLAAMHEDRKVRPASLPTFNPSVTPAVDAIIQKLLEPDRARRYQSAAQLREDIERQLSDRPLKYAADRSLVERARKWHRRHPRLAAAAVAAAALGIVVLFPTTVIAVRQSQIEEHERVQAERAREKETAEARQQWLECGRESLAVQVLLATSTGERQQLDNGLARGVQVLKRYGIGTDDEWRTRSRFSRLSEAEQTEVRMDLGEMLLFMCRGETTRAKDTVEPAQRDAAYRQALGWNDLAYDCFPTGEQPAVLFDWREELLKLLPKDAARPALTRPARERPTEYDAYHESADLSVKGKHREALNKLIPFAEAHPRHYQSWFLRGFSHEHLGEFGESIACWNACIALDPELPYAWLNRGLVRLRQKDYDRADADFTRCLKLRPGWDHALISRAIARKDSKKYGPAADDLDGALKISHQRVRVLFLISEVHELDHRPEEAKKFYAEAMKLQPDDELGWATRGHARMDKESEAALVDFDRALGFNPRSQDALVLKSLTLSENLKRNHEGIAVLDKFLEYYPQDIAVRMGRGVLLARVGRCEQARKDAEECLRYKPGCAFNFQAAGLYAQISRHEKDTTASKEALRQLAVALQNGYSDLEVLNTDPDLDPIRGDEEFKRLANLAASLKISAGN